MGRVLRRILRSVMCRCNANTEEMGRACCDQLHGAGDVSLCVREEKCDRDHPSQEISLLYGANTNL